MTLSSSEIVCIEELCHSSLFVSVSAGRVEKAKTSCVYSEVWDSYPHSCECLETNAGACGNPWVSNTCENFVRGTVLVVL